MTVHNMKLGEDASVLSPRLHPLPDIHQAMIMLLKSARMRSTQVTIPGPQGGADSAVPMPWYDQQRAFDFVCKHGLAVRAVGVPSS